MSDRNPGELGINGSFSEGPRDGAGAQNEAEAAVQPGWEVTLVRTSPSPSCVLHTRLNSILLPLCLCFAWLGQAGRMVSSRKLRKKIQYTCPGLVRSCTGQFVAGE